MLVRVSENQKSENGLKSFFLEKKDYLPFSYVQLVKVSVHSGRCFCTFTCEFVLLPICACAVGYVVCTLAFYVHLACLFVRLVRYVVHLVKVLVHLVKHYVQLPWLPVHLDVKQ